MFGVTGSVWRLSVQVLEVLWELAHLPTLPTTLVQQALEEHLGILSDAYAVKETVKRSYIIKCIEDIKKVRQTDWRCGLMQHLAPSYMLGSPRFTRFCPISRSGQCCVLFFDINLLSSSHGGFWPCVR